MVLPFVDETSRSAAYETSGHGAPAAVTGITVDKSVEFSYEELATATNNFSLANKIGQGGFGAVYYAELRGEVSNDIHNCLLLEALFQKKFHSVICSSFSFFF